jgi:Trypsin
LLGGNSRDTMREHPHLNFTAHPQFDRNSRAFDICVIRLTNPITPSAEIHPIALPPLYNPPPVDMPFEHEEIFIDGLGMTGRSSEPAPFLYRSFQRVTSDERCRAFFIVDTQQAFCAEDREERSNVCSGDLGSPVIGNYRRQDYLAGIVRIHPSCGVNQPAAYTRISFFTMWIQSQIVI